MGAATVQTVTIEVRPAAAGDVRELSRVLARAFVDDPVMTWLFPVRRTRERRLMRLFWTVTRFHHLGNGAVEVAGRPSGIGAAALWDPPGRWSHSGPSEVAMIPAMIWTFGGRLCFGRAMGETIHQHHPTEPHWYLSVIGSDPEVRGGGFGQALLHSRLDRCDAEYAPAYLESSNPDNVPYYQRFGFEVTGEIRLPRGGPTVWAMWRDPR